MQIIDKDGKKTYSPVVTIRYSGYKDAVKLYPTVITSGELYASVDVAKEQTASIRVFTVAGTLAHQGAKILLPGNNNFTIATGNFPKGTLYVTIAGDGFMITRKIIKQ